MAYRAYTGGKGNRREGKGGGENCAKTREKKRGGEKGGGRGKKGYAGGGAKEVRASTHTSSLIPGNNWSARKEQYVVMGDIAANRDCGYSLFCTGYRSGRKGVRIIGGRKLIVRRRGKNPGRLKETGGWSQVTAWGEIVGIHKASRGNDMH